MQLRIDQLGAHLAAGRLASGYVLSGDEPLLSIEAQDAIRGAAREKGFEEREVIQADARMDWSALDAAVAARSLFASRRLVEIRLPTGKPGKSGARALLALAARKDPDLLTIVALPRHDWAARKSEWAQALASSGVWIDVETVARERLAEWIAARLARQKQRAQRDALEFLADRVEGNLLAAHQEIGKLALLYEEGELGLAQVRAAVLDVARFDAAGLPAAMLIGDARRIVRLIEGLQAEGEPLPLILWIVSEELRSLLRLKQAQRSGRPVAAATRGMRLSATPVLVERFLPQIDEARIARLLARCAGLDRLAKGLRVAGIDQDPWVELTDLALSLRAA